MQRSSPFATAGLRRVDASLGRALDQVDAIGGERVVGQAAVLVVALRLRVQLVVASAMGAQAAVVADLERPVRDEPQEVEARDSLLLQQVESVGIAFPEERHQHRPGVDGLLAARLAHSGSIVLKKGNSAAFAICSTVATLVSAIS